jgi:predicted transcriptional regulator
MSNRNPLQMKKQILSALMENKSMSYAQLEKKVNSNWQTIRSHCKELEVFNCIDVKEMKSHTRNNKPYTEINITKEGIVILKKLRINVLT